MNFKNLNLSKDTKIIVQGITGHHGSFHTELMKEYGTQIIAGVTPGKGGQVIHEIPVYDSVGVALSSNPNHKITWSIIFVPAKFAKDAALEAITAGLNVVVITENIPVYDSIKIINQAKKKNLLVIGPNCPGIIKPGEIKMGIMPSHIFKKGSIGLVSRSGTLTYEIINQLSKHDLGQSLVIGMGGDPVVGADFIDALNFFEKDLSTKQIVLIGEIGGNLEELAAEHIKNNISKPVVAYVVGVSAPQGKKMGHAGAIISGSSGTAKSKIESLKSVGVKVASIPSEIVSLLK
ncbi:succinate--CoA ligase subunit alpha [Candidatus Woesearchaeota archaeon]|jgi:succinyl-CoA synthetase alpha subunit|nr:succinate--CoA ligase subunit alpha [Candidatus Woesearchaeota archaeon]